MTKIRHEIRDPIHNFIRLDTTERKIVDSPPFQRLRDIHQLAMTYMVYPGATHRRFEHSLGVMDVAGRIYDVITNDNNIHHVVKEQFRQELDPNSSQIKNWREILRIAALCHDIGHFPFSHAAESQILPDGVNHEDITVDLIKEYISPIVVETPSSFPWQRIAKLAVGQKKWLKWAEKNNEKDKNLSVWEEILSEIITGNAFGADRIDYLLRDSYHVGVAYGKFDIHRLIDTLRVLPTQYEKGERFSLGMEFGGLHSAEALLLARYFMFQQVYFHPIRRIYDFHLQEFIKFKYPNFPVEPEGFLDMTDAKILTDISYSKNKHAEIIKKRKHFKEYHIGDGNLTLIKQKLQEEYGEMGDVYFIGEEPDPGKPKDNTNNQTATFPVLKKDNSISNSRTLSDILKTIPTAKFKGVFIDRDEESKVKSILNERSSINES